MRPKGLCEDCNQVKCLYNWKSLCRRCYQSRKKVALLSHGISFPKRLAIGPKEWTFEVLEKC